MERRLSAILAADMVGYSRLIENDEIGTLERQKVHRNQLINPSFRKFNGRIVKEMGDGILVEFPSVVQAVECAIEIQTAMRRREAEAHEDRRIIYRVGINLGDIVVDGDDIHGDGVNVAARLEALAEPGGICISGTAYDTMRTALDIHCEPMGKLQVKNIGRPITAYKVLIHGEHARPIAKNPRRHSATRYALAIGILLALAVGALGWWWLNEDGSNISRDNHSPNLQSKPSIAVLPFDNVGGDPDQEYFIDGMTDDLITDLSKLSSLFVIARNSTFSYKGLDVEPTQVAKELNVRYVLNGSVRASPGRLRINSRLIDAQTGGQIWADRFDRPKGDVFSLQDDITSNIVSALALQLNPDEKSRLNPSDHETSPEVYDIYLRGVEALRQYTPDSISMARYYFLKALAQDPDYARAYATLAFAYIASGIFFRDKNTQDALDNAMRYSRRALDLDPTLPQAHFALANTYLRWGRHTEALAAAREAVKYDPNYADGYVALANVLLFDGKGYEALTHMRKAMELNPRYSAAYLDILGRAYFVEENFEKASRTFEECISRDPFFMACHAFLAATYALAGNIPDAEWEVEEVHNLEPEFTVSNNNISTQFNNSNSRDLFDRGLALAGFPD